MILYHNKYTGPYRPVEIIWFYLLTTMTSLRRILRVQIDVLKTYIYDVKKTYNTTEKDVNMTCFLPV